MCGATRRRAAVAVLALFVCAFAPPLDARGTLRLATTTSTQDSGLLDAILPAFEKTCACRVSVIAVGSGQAIELGRRGDADVLLVHSRKAEDRFVAAGHSRGRFDVMYNDFVLVGPEDDPAKVGGRTLAKDAFTAIARAEARFASRGDESGTHVAEKEIWAAAGVAHQAAWHLSLGQGMGETLMFAHEQRAYTLTDRGTWLALRHKLPGLRVWLGGQSPADNPDAGLRNQYGVLAVSPEAHPGVNAALARRFVDWLLSPATQKAIGEYGVSRFGQPLFRPNASTVR